MKEAYSVGLDHVSVTKRGRPILVDLQLELSPGLTALLGRNGAGKTTLLRVLAGVQPPSEGRVSIVSGQLYGAKRSPTDHFKALGWVPQGPGYPARMKVQSFVEYAAWLKCVEPRQRRASAVTALRACKADSLAGRAFRTLSGGERQRVILASAIVGDPKFLLLDEPTAGLDPAQRESYLALLRDLGETTTVLYSTHLVDDVVRTATRILVLDEGRLSADLRGSDLAVPADQLGDRLRRAVIESTDRNA